MFSKSNRVQYHYGWDFVNGHGHCSILGHVSHRPEKSLVAYILIQLIMNSWGHERQRYVDLFLVIVYC